MDQKTIRNIGTAVLIAVLLITYVVRVVRKPDQPPPPDAPVESRDQGAPSSGIADASVHLALGNPSDATDDPANANNYLMRKTYFALSYNNSKGGPNWVSWCLKDSDFGTAERTQFYPDPDLPHGFHRVTPNEYTGSGFDRGHMCPRSDRTNTPEAANATFVMTNLIPQSPHCNQRAWADLEDYCRALVRHKSRVLYIVSGPSGKGGEGSKGPADAIGGGRITVPSKCWKVVVEVENGTGNAEDFRRVGSSSRMIAVVMPNDQSVGHGWAKYRTSVKEVESMTGYKFFDRVPGAILEPLKAKVDDEHIPAVHHPKTGD